MQEEKNQQRRIGDVVVGHKDDALRLDAMIDEHMIRMENVGLMTIIKPAGAAGGQQRPNLAFIAFAARFG